MEKMSLLKKKKRELKIISTELKTFEAWLKSDYQNLEE